jgi:anti-sigma factor RsiW
MNCDEARPLIGAYVDRELPERERNLLREHLESCADCGPEAAAIARLSGEIRATQPDYRAPAALRAEVRRALRRETRDAAAPGPLWLAYAASLLLALVLGAGITWLVTGQRQETVVADEVIDSHLRSLLARHLVDVASSDKHTVKPWFAGKTGLSPPGVDLAAQGFPLVGGRLDLIGGRPVPALVYRAGKHVINVFVLPAAAGDHAATVARRGYTARHWVRGDLGYWAVSDAAPEEFDKFVRAFRAAAGG